MCICLEILGLMVCFCFPLGATPLYMMYGGDTVKLARRLIRLSEAIQWAKAALSKVCATPWDLHRPRELEEIFKDESDEKKEELFEEKVSLARQVYIKPKDLEEHGLISGMPEMRAD